ncbi:MAG: hypothetical protein ABIJ97_03095 [Bacteroidota bacterium]
MKRKIREQIEKEISGLKTDMQKWKWIKKNQDTGVIVFLDNDSTAAEIEFENGNSILFYFEDFIGWADGIFTLLKAMGIKAETV